MNTDLTHLKADIVKALAHPARIAIVETLASGEQCVCSVAAMVGMEISTASRHLSVLRNAGVLEARKEGLKVFYRVRVPCVVHFLDCIEAVVHANLERHERALGGTG
jgi:ArsR family transcriptional regulator